MVQALPWCSWVRGFSWVSVGIRASSFFSILAINRLQLSPRWLHSNASKPKQLNLPAFSSYYSTPSSSFLSKTTAPTNNVHALRGALCCVGVKLSALLLGGGMLEVVTDVGEESSAEGLQSSPPAQLLLCLSNTGVSVLDLDGYFWSEQQKTKVLWMKQSSGASPGVAVAVLSFLFDGNDV